MAGSLGCRSLRWGLLFLFLTLLLGADAVAQVTGLFRSPDSPALRQRVRDRDADLTDFTVLELDAVAALGLLGERPMSLTVDLPDPRGRGSLSLEMNRFDLLGPDFKVIEMPANVAVADLPESVFYRGEVAGQTGSVAVISIIDGEVSGLVSLPGESGELNLVRLDSEDAYLFYDDAAIKDKFTDLDCEVLEPGGQRPVEKSKPEGVVAKVDGCFGIYLDIGEEIYSERGGTNGAVAYLQGAFAQVATLYANEEIDITISGTRVWTSREPFYDNLEEYQAYRADNNVDGSLAHYVHRAGGGGVAYLNVLCNKRYGYGLSGINNSYRNVPNYSWTVFVLAHELGHNFGSAHTHDCAWNGDDTPIDGCGSSSNGCGVSAGIPQGGGTIMSYCHLTSGGVNFTNGFGDQPGNRIRSRAGAASCRGYDCGTGGAGGGGSDDQASIPDGKYYIGIRHSGKRVRVAGANRTKGTSIVQYDARDWRSMRWNVVHLGDDVYRITSDLSGQSLDVSGGSTQNGADIIQWPYGGGTNQRWKAESLGDGYFHLRARHSGKCMNVFGSSTANNANVVQWSCTSATNDDFRFEGISAGVLAEAVAGSQLDLYPNPTSADVHIELRLPEDSGGGRVNLIDVGGRTVQEWSFAARAGVHELDIDLTTRPRGVYLVRIQAGEETFTRRLVVID